MAPAGQAHLDYAFAALNVAGGLMGYVKKKSMPSVRRGRGGTPCEIRVVLSLQ